jgi:hypothetical protein
MEKRVRPSFVSDQFMANAKSFPSGTGHESNKNLVY